MFTVKLHSHYAPYPSLSKAPSTPGMRVTIVSTYPPRPCGIGTFSSDLRDALLATAEVGRVEVAALVTGTGTGASDQRPEVVTTIRQDVEADYVAAARLLNGRPTDNVIIEHEFGIFGGPDGDLVLSLARELAIPYMVTLHTVTTQPSPGQALVVQELASRASLVTVFTETARRLVTTGGLVAPAKVRVVPHGAPVVITRAADRGARAVRRFGRRFVLTTFGLISAGKGLETVIEALPAVVEEHPEVVFVVAGQTHPEVAKRDGEEYRHRLQGLVRSLELQDHVLFDDRFLSVTELADLLAATDLYVAPYRSRDQIVSGALTFAVAAGLPVVATPFLYAQDLLSSGAGVLVPFDDPTSLASAINALVSSPERLQALRSCAEKAGANLAWPTIGRTTARLLHEACAPDRASSPAGPVTAGPVATGPVAAGPVAAGPVAAGPVAAGPVGGPQLPPVRADHLLELVDDVGIVQHAHGVIPDRATGYCVDDVARLAQVALQLGRHDDDPSWYRLASRALGFLHHATTGSSPGAGMRNFMSYERRWLDAPHVGDHLGRAVWALGELLSEPAATTMSDAAHETFDLLLRSVDRPDISPRTAAFAILGLARAHPDRLDERSWLLLAQLTRRLTAAFHTHASKAWPWFENSLTYDNARLAQALIAGSHRLGDATGTEIGLQALTWYGNECGLEDDLVRLPGNEGRRRGEPAPGMGDEQPLDAAALVEAEIDALAATGDGGHAERARSAFEWFLGRNHLWLPVYDALTGGCHDGLSRLKVNPNEGAESTLAFMHARLALQASGQRMAAGPPQQLQGSAA